MAEGLRRLLPVLADLIKQDYDYFRLVEKAVQSRDHQALRELSLPNIFRKN